MLKIQNEYLTVEVSLQGAELMSVRSADGVEYLWQGDPAYWSGRAPIMFPWTGRLLNGQYRYQGKIYEMGIHGFARKQPFTCAAQSQDSLTLTLASNEETKAQYPFDFLFSVTYTLREKTLEVTFAATNTGSNTMYFAWGGHPGFNVPLVEGETMADYTLTFSDPCYPERALFSATNVLVDGAERFYLENDQQLQLSHGLFDQDAIFLKHMAKSVVMKSSKSGRGVQLSYPDMAHLGLWHMPKTDAPYVCIEPWSSLPGREGILEDLSCRSDLLSADPGETRETTWTIRIDPEA